VIINETGIIPSTSSIVSEKQVSNTKTSL